MKKYYSSPLRSNPRVPFKADVKEKDAIIPGKDDTSEISAEYLAYPADKKASDKPQKVGGGSSIRRKKSIIAPSAIIPNKNQPSMEGLEPEAIVEADDRVQANPREYPYTAICSLRIRSSSGKTYMGTGFFISSRILLTAGHCVYIHDDNGWPESIEVIPGRDKNEKPFGSVVADQFMSFDDWIENRDRNFDMGVIILPEDCPFGKKVGWFGCKTFLDEKEYMGKTFNISGYPGEKGGREQWKMSGEGESQGPLLKYDIDTTGGQSGSPVWIVNDNKYYVIGVHTMGNSSLGNFATRIDRDFMRDILEMIKDFS